MAKLTQAEIKAKADEYAAIGEKIEKLAEKREGELAPLRAKFEKDAAPITKKFDAKISKLAESRAAIESEVLGWLNGVGKPIVLEGDLAVAAVEMTIGKRTIDPEKFFKTVKERTAAFWECLTVGIAKAEKMIGKDRVDQLADKESKLVATIKIK